MEDKKTKRLNIILPVDIHCEIKKQAAIRNITMTEFIIRMFGDKIARDKKYE